MDAETLCAARNTLTLCTTVLDEWDPERPETFNRHHANDMLRDTAEIANGYRYPKDLRADALVLNAKIGAGADAMTERQRAFSSPGPVTTGRMRPEPTAIPGSGVPRSGG